MAGHLVCVSVQTKQFNTETFIHTGLARYLGVFLKYFCFLCLLMLQLMVFTHLMSQL